MPNILFRNCHRRRTCSPSQRSRAWSTTDIRISSEAFRWNRMENILCLDRTIPLLKVMNRSICAASLNKRCIPRSNWNSFFFSILVWEISTGRCIKTIETGDVVRSVSWCPNPKISLIAIASGQRLLLVNHLVGDKMLVKKTDDILTEAPKIDLLENERIKTAVQWATAEGEDFEKGYRLIITHFKPIKQVTWHGRGDYFASVMPEGANRSTLIHQLSKRRTQVPFAKSKGLIQCVLFHPVKPCLFVAVSLSQLFAKKCSISNHI